MFTTPSQLYRIDDTTWSLTCETPFRNQFKEIRLSAPHLRDGEKRFELITAIRNVFEANAEFLTKDRFREGVRIAINKPDSLVNGTWDISHQIPFLGKKILLEFRQRFSFTWRLPELDVVVIDIKRANDRLPSRLFSTADRIAALQIQMWEQPSVLNLHLPVATPPERDLLQESFQDPFTRIATEALETICPLFVLETTHRGDYRFVLDAANNLSLQRLSSVDEDAAANFLSENRAVVSRYQNFLLQEHGQDTISYIESECGLNFNEMRDKGQPLLPDHISKCNVAANNIELQHVESLWGHLKELYSLLRRPPRPSMTVVEFLLQVNTRLRLPLRNLRNLLRLIPTEDGRRPTVENLRGGITNLVGQYTQTPLMDLPSDLFNMVVEILMPSDAERQRAFTGRKIRHVCVMGPNTMGDPNTPCPCRDLFELLHVFEDLRREDQWENFYELLSFLAKKRLYRQNAAPNDLGQTVRVGLLIPGPNAAGGSPRWFYVDGFFDDSRGNINYALLPACNTYRTQDDRPLPLVKLFRDTATKTNVEHSWDSVLADLNPQGPGSLNPEISIPYEWNHFFDRTIPIWVGYLLLARRVRELAQYQKDLLVDQRELFLEKAFETFKSYMLKLHPEEPLDHIISWRHERGFDEIERVLLSFAERFRESPEFKKGQDLACVGHSLGGVLAQQSLFYFSTRYERMPLPGCQFICYSNDGPAMTNDQDKEFMRFGRSHRILFRLSRVVWRVYHSFQAGDFLPQAGGSHLGTTGYDAFEDPDWLIENIAIFSPLEGATARTVVIPRAHDRRFEGAIEHADFSRAFLSPQKLAEFDHSLVLSEEMRREWKCGPFNYPKVLELVRGSAGWISQKTGLLWLIKKVEEAGVGIRDRNDVLAVRYSPALIERTDTT